MSAIDVIASELLKSANEADLNYKKTRDQAQRDKAIRLRKIVENLKLLTANPTLDQVLTAGNTSTNTLNVGGITTDYVQLGTTATPTLQPGMFAWNDQDGTADLRLKGGNVTLQVGQETLARVVNKTGADLLESQYKVVRVRIASEGGSQGQRLAVVLAQGNNDPDSVTTLGIVTETILNNQEGFITIFGNVNGINTTGSLQGETWVDGDVLFLSPTTPGALTKVKPVAPNHTVVIGYVIYAHGVNGKIFVKVDNGYELDELHNVKITSVANNDLLQYDSVQQVWKNVAASVAVPTPTLAAVTTAGNTTTNFITVGGVTANGSITANGAIARGNYFNNTLVAAANNDVLVGLDINPTFTNGAFTGVDNWDLRTKGKVLVSSTTTGNVFPLVVRSTNYPGILLQSGSTGTNHSAAPYDGFAFWINYDVSHAKGLITNYENNGISIYNGTNPAVGLTIFGSTNNVAINTTTDAGYKLDVAGTVRVVSGITATSNGHRFGNLEVLTSGFAGGTGQGIVVSGVDATFQFHGSGAPADMFQFRNWAGISTVTNINSVDRSVIRIYGGYQTGNINGLAGNILTLTPTYNFTGATTHIVRGLYYNPTLTSLTNATHRAIETTSGDVIINTQSASANAGYTTMAIGGSSGAYFQMYVGTNPTAQTLRGQIWAVGNNLIFNNPSVGYLGLYTTLYSGITVWPTTGNVYVGTSASTDAGYKLDVNGTGRYNDTLLATANASTHLGLVVQPNSQGNAVFRYLRTAITNFATFEFANGSISSSTAKWGVGLRETSDNDFHFYNHTASVDQLVIKDSTGYVGVGTSNPTELLHIVNNTTGNKFARISAGAADASAAWVAQNDQVDNIVYRVFGSAVTGSQMGQALARSASLIANLGGTGKFLIGSYSGTDLIFGTSDQARMRLVDATGNFLIGTMTDNGNKLTVSGNIDAQGYKVNNVLGYTGILNIPTNPPGQQNIDIQGGIVINIF